MSILDRSALEQSTLADLHAIASELSIDSFRRLRKAQLIDAIIERQGGDDQDGGDQHDDEVPDGSGGERDDDEVPDAEALAAAVGDELRAREQGQPAPRRRRGRRGGRGRAGRSTAGAEADEGEQERQALPTDGPDEIEEELEHPEAQLVEGVVEVLPGGSAFVRVAPPEPSDDDVYVSAAQVRRCGLVSGDRIAGRLRPPRRSERFASLVHIESVNGRSASELADAARFEDLPAAFPAQRVVLGSEDPTLAAIDSLAPIGRGSRVTIAGGALTGKTEALRRVAAALHAIGDLEVWLVLTGVRPEEVPEWEQGPIRPTAALPLGSPADAVSRAVELAAEQVRRHVARGAHAALLIDTLDAIGQDPAHRLLASARNLDEQRSLTVIATASHPIGGETTIVSLDPLLAGAGNFPAIDVQRTWTLHADRLVGAEAAQKIARVRAAAFRR